MTTPPPPVLTDPTAADVERHPGGPFVDASIDEGGFLWAVSREGLFLLRPGATSWEVYGNSHAGGILGNGHENDGVLSVAGGEPGEAWVGYKGLFINGETDDPNIIPESVRTSGGADRIVATPNGITLLHHIVFWTPPGILKNEPLGRWKIRSIYTIIYNHGPSGFAGDVFFGGNHGVGQWIGKMQVMYEHAHAGWNYCPGGPSCTLFTGDHHGVAIASDGNLWMAADWAASRLDYMTQGLDGRIGDPDVPNPDALRIWVNRSKDPLGHPEWGGRDFTMALAFDAHGDLWAGSYFNGIVRIPMNGSFSAATSQADIDYWAHAPNAKVPGWTDTSDNVMTLAGDPDGSMWVGGQVGAYRFVAATGQWVSYRSVVPGANVNRITFDPRPGKRGVVIATDAGAFVYHGK